MTNLSFKIIAFSIFYLLYFILSTPHFKPISVYDIPKLQTQYDISTYNQGSAIIEDHELYALAGYNYLTQGKLDKINIEHPPLGKYIIGLSLLLSSSTLSYQLLFSFILILMIYLISIKINKKYYLAVLALFLFCIDKMFVSRAIIPELDLPLTGLTLVYIYILTKTQLNWKRVIYTGIILGIISGIKYPTIVLILLLATTIYLLLVKEKRLILKLLTISAITLLIFIIQYSPLILDRGLNSFIEVQTKATKIHLSHVPQYPPFAPTRVMIFNQWPVWWDKEKPIYQVEEWSVFWPILWILLMTIPLTIYFKKLKCKEVRFGLIFFYLYFIFINSRLFFPHYLLPVLAIGYPLLIWQIGQIFELFKAK